MYKNQKGTVPVLVLVAFVGILAFLAITSITSFKEKLFSSLFPKPTTQALSDFPKGVHMFYAPWFRTDGSYNYAGLNKDLDGMKSADISWVKFYINPNDNPTSICGPTYLQMTIAKSLQLRGMTGLPLIGIKNNTTTTATDAEIAAFKTWLDPVVRCLSPYYKNWEVWNEPNIHQFWNINESLAETDPAYVASVASYIKYLKAAYETIKAIDPSLKVISGGLAQWQDEKYTKVLINLGAYQYFDIFGFHPYSDTGVTGVINELNASKAIKDTNPLMAAKPYWITEVGFTSNPNEYPGNTGGSEDKKALYLKDSWIAMRNWGINYPIMYYYWDKDNNINTGHDLVYTDRTTSPYNVTFSPAFYALKDLWQIPSPPPTFSPNPNPTVTVTVTPTPTLAVTPTPTPIVTSAPTPSLAPTSAPTSAPLPTIVEAETMSLISISQALKIMPDSYTSNGQYMMFYSNAISNVTFNNLSNTNQIIVRASGDQCNGAPTMIVKVDNVIVLNQAVSSTTWADYPITAIFKAISAGLHNVSVEFTNDFITYKGKSGKLGCDRNLKVDKITFK